MVSSAKREGEEGTRRGRAAFESRGEARYLDMGFIGGRAPTVHSPVDSELLRTVLISPLSAIV